MPLALTVYDPCMTEAVLFAVTRVVTFDGLRSLTNASGFFFERDVRQYLVTSRHVLIDPPSGHFPNRIEIELHVDAANLTRTVGFSVPLYSNGESLIRAAKDSGGDIDVALIELNRTALPQSAILNAFTPTNLQLDFGTIDLGTPLLILGFPLGFHDTVHHLPVARQGAMASSFGIRFQGKGCFLTDARTHRGTSGAPVLMHSPALRQDSTKLPWQLLGIHSARVDMANRDEDLDEFLALNCTWYADVLMALTAE